MRPEEESMEIACRTIGCSQRVPDVIFIERAIEWLTQRFSITISKDKDGYIIEGRDFIVVDDQLSWALAGAVHCNEEMKDSKCS